jgi:ATP-binding cassette, subfamily C, bacterial CydC
MTAAGHPARSRPPGRLPLRRPGRGPLARMLRLARPMRARLLAAVLAGAAATGSGVALLAVSGFLLARASEHPNIVAISIAVVAVRALGIGRGVFRYAERLGSHDVAFRILADVRVAIYRRLERLAPSGLAAFRSGDLLARLISDVDSIQDLFIRGLAPPLTAALVGGAAVLATTALLLPAGLVLCAGMLLAGLAVPLFAARAASSAARQTGPARGELAAALTDVVDGAADLLAYGVSPAITGRVQAADAKLTAAARRAARAAGLGTGLGSAAAGGTLWCVLLLGVAASGSGAISRVPLAVITLTALAAFEAVSGLPAAAIQLSHARTAAERVAGVLDSPDPVAEPDQARLLPGGPLNISLHEVSVRYAPGGPLALAGIDLDFPPGRRTAIVGPTGAGKSTIAALLLRFCDAETGTISVNGHDLSDYAADGIRARIGGCPQDAYIFDTTIRANLLLARPGATDSELMDAASQARIWDWIQSLPLGFDTPVGTHGARMSGGQRQRLALARALLADPEFLILDEPTASLDEQNRRALMADLLAVTAGRSVLLITHDLEGLDQMDEIIVLADGKIAERGTHEQLAGAGGAYQRMWAAQRWCTDRHTWEGSGDGLQSACVLG